MYVLLTTLLFSYSAVAGDFEESLLKRWQSIIEVKKDPKIKQNTPIEQPAGTSIKVFEVILNAKNFRPIKDCVLYLVPSNGETGTLYIHSAPLKQSCEDFHLNFNTLKKEQIFNFAYEHKKKELKLHFDNMVLRIPFLHDEFVEVSTLKEESQYKFKNQDYCYQVDDKCRVLKPNRCDYCPKSFLNVVETNCKTDFSKICVDHGCGDLNQPACIRGWVASNFKLDYCLPDSPVGFCRPGLRVICEAERLVCK